MGIKGKKNKRVVWTEEHDEVLKASVEACRPLRENLGGTHEMWWGVVAGHTNLPITPGSARARWHRIQSNEKKEESGGNGIHKDDDVINKMWSAVKDTQKQMDEIQEQLSDLQQKLNNFMITWGV